MASARASATLPLAARELAGIARLETVKLHQRQKLAHLVADGLGRGPRLARPCAQAEGDVVHHRHVAEQGVVLEHEADAALAQGELIGIDVAKKDLPAIDLFETGNGP
jgi:hypothetical protein